MIRECWVTEWRLLEVVLLLIREGGLIRSRSRNRRRNSSLLVLLKPRGIEIRLTALLLHIQECESLSGILGRVGETHLAFPCPSFDELLSTIDGNHLVVFIVVSSPPRTDCWTDGTSSPLALSLPLEQVLVRRIFVCRTVLALVPGQAGLRTIDTRGRTCRRGARVSGRHWRAKRLL